MDRIIKILTLKDFNFNLSADGYLYIDETEGVVLTSKGSVGDNIVVLGRVEDKTDVHDSRVGNATNPGLNVRFTLWLSKLDSPELNSDRGIGCINQWQDRVEC